MLNSFAGLVQSRRWTGLLNIMQINRKKCLQTFLYLCQMCTDYDIDSKRAQCYAIKDTRVNDEVNSKFLEVYNL